MQTPILPPFASKMPASKKKSVITHYLLKWFVFAKCIHTRRQLRCAHILLDFSFFFFFRLRYFKSKNTGAPLLASYKLDHLKCRFFFFLLDRLLHSWQFFGLIFHSTLNRFRKLQPIRLAGHFDFFFLLFSSHNRIVFSPLLSLFVTIIIIIIKLFFFLSYYTHLYDA